MQFYFLVSQYCKDVKKQQSVFMEFPLYIPNFKALFQQEMSEKLVKRFIDAYKYTNRVVS